jgi:hypothetical protein
MINEITSLYQNIESLYFENKEKIRFNQEYAMSRELERTLVNSLVGTGIIS